MLQTNGYSPPRRKKEDRLMLAIDGLRQALDADFAGQERKWAENVEERLTQIQQQLQQHTAIVEGPEGLFAEVQEKRPTLVRQVEGLCSDYEHLLQEVPALRTELLHAAGAFKPLAGPSRPAGAPASPDLTAIRQQVEEFRARLDQDKHTETKLVLESVNTDIGVGD
jgi:hypothetical protein